MNSSPSLSDQYNSLLNQYQQTYQNYIQSSHISHPSHMVTIDDSAFWGDAELSKLSQSSVDHCLHSCRNNSSCSGATYDQTTQSCYLRTGNGNVSSDPGKTAIVSQSLQYSYQLKQINQQLLDIHQQMKDKLNQSYSSYQDKSQEQQQQNQLLDYNQSILQQERMRIDEMIHEYELLNAADRNSQVVVTQEYSSYIVYFLIAVLLFLLVMKYSVFSFEQRGGNSYHSFIPLKK